MQPARKDDKMTIPDAKILIHTVSNKLTAALGYLSLAEDDAEQRLAYLKKANRELKEASNAVKALMAMINAAVKDAATLAAEAAKVATEATERLAAATEAADEMAKKSTAVLEKIEKIVPIDKPKRPR
jgi:methyl-accepting chemotaxis protein